MKNPALRFTSLMLAYLMAAGISLPVYAEGGNPTIAVGTLSAADAVGDPALAEQFPAGYVNFSVATFETAENNTDGVQVAIVRQGGTTGEVSVDLRALDLASAYGKDYIVKVYDTAGEQQGALKADPESEPLALSVAKDKVTPLDGDGQDSEADIAATAAEMIENGETSRVTLITDETDEVAETSEPESVAEPEFPSVTEEATEAESITEAVAEAAQADEAALSLETADTATEPTEETEVESATPEAAAMAAPAPEAVTEPISELTSDPKSEVVTEAAPSADASASSVSEIVPEVELQAIADQKSEEAVADTTVTDTTSEPGEESEATAAVEEEEIEDAKTELAAVAESAQSVELTPTDVSAEYTLQQAKAADTGVESDAIVWENLTEAEQQALLQDINSVNDSVLQEALQSIPAASTTLTFAEGEYVKYVLVTPIDDTAAEADEEFYLLLTNPQGGLVCGENSFSLGKIIEDDESEISTVTLSDARLSADGTQALVTVQRTGALAQYATVYVGTVEGSATDGSDYAGGMAQLVFTPGMAQQTASVHILENRYRNEPRDFSFTLTTDDQQSACGEESTATLSIPASANAMSADEINAALSGQSTAPQSDASSAKVANTTDNSLTEGTVNAAPDADPDTVAEQTVGDSPLATGLTGDAAALYLGDELPEGAFLVSADTDMAGLTEDQRKLVALAESFDAKEGRKPPETCVYFMYTAFTNQHPIQPETYPTKTITNTFNGVTYKGILFENKTPAYAEVAKLSGLDFAGSCEASVFCAGPGSVQIHFPVTQYNGKYSDNTIRDVRARAADGEWKGSDFSAPLSITVGDEANSGISLFGARLSYYTASAVTVGYANARFGANELTYKREVEIKEVDHVPTVTESKKTQYTPGEMHEKSGATQMTIKKGNSYTFLPDYNATDNPGGIYAKLAGVRLRWGNDYYVDKALTPNPEDGSITLTFDSQLLADKQMRELLWVHSSNPNEPISICPYYKAETPSLTLQASPLYAQLQDFGTDNQTIPVNTSKTKGFINSGDTIKNIAVKARVMTEDVTMTALLGPDAALRSGEQYLKLTGNRRGDKSVKLYDYTVTTAGKHILNASSQSPTMQMKASPRVYGVYASQPTVRLNGNEYDLSKDADREKYSAAAAAAAKANEDSKYWLWFTLKFDESVPAEELQRNKDNYANPQKAIFNVYKEDGTLRKSFTFDYKNGRFDSGSGYLRRHGVGNWGALEWTDTATVTIEATGKDGKTYRTSEVDFPFLTSIGAAASMRSNAYVSNLTKVASSAIGQTSTLNCNNALEAYHFTAFGSETMLPLWGDYSPDYNGDGVVEPSELARLQRFLKAHGYKENADTLWDSHNYIGTGFSVLPRLENPGRVYYQFIPKQGGSSRTSIYVQLYKSGATVLQPTKRDPKPMQQAQIFIVGEKMTADPNVKGAYTTGKNFQDLNYYGTVMLGDGTGAYNFPFTATGGKTSTVTINPLEIMPATDFKIENRVSDEWKDMHIGSTYALDIDDVMTRISFRMNSNFTGVVPNRARILIYDENGVVQRTWTATSLNGVFTYLINLKQAGVKEGWTMGIAGAVVDASGIEKAVFPDADVGLIFTRKMQDWQLFMSYVFKTNKKVPVVGDLMEKGFNASEVITASSGSDTTTHSKFTDTSGRDRVQTVYYYNVNADYNYQYGTAAAKMAEKAQRVENGENAAWKDIKACGDEYNAIAQVFTLDKNTDARALASASNMFSKTKVNQKDEKSKEEASKVAKKVILDLDLLVSAAFIIDDYGYELTKEDPDDPEFKKVGYKYFYSMAILAQLSFSARGSISIPTPVCIPIRIELSGEVTGGVVYSSQVPDGYHFNKAYKITNDITKTEIDGINHNVTYGRLMGSARVTVGGGVGWAQAKVMLEGRFALDIASATPVDPKHTEVKHSTGGRFSVKLGIFAKLLFMEKFFKLTDWDTHFLEGVNGVPVTPTNATTPYLPTITQDDVMSRDYLSARGDAIDAAMTDGLASLQNGVFPNGTMALISLGGGKQLLVYQDDNGGSSALNASALYARLYDGKSWKDPILLDTDTTWDEAPTAALLSDGRIVVAWTDARKDLTLGNFADQLHKMRLSGRILKADGTPAGAPFEITRAADAGDSADSGVKLTVYNDGTADHVLAIYQKSDYKNLYAPTTRLSTYEGADPTEGFENITRAYTALSYRTGTVNGSTVDFDTAYPASVDPAFAAKYYGQRFVSAEVENTVIENEDGTKTAVAGATSDAMLVEYDVARDTKTGTLLLAYTLDKDNDSSTEGDRYLYLRTFDAVSKAFGDPILIDHVARGVASPQFAANADTTQLYWLTPTGICTVDAVGVAQGAISAAPAGLMADGSNENVNYVTLGNEQENPIQEFRAVSDGTTSYVVWARSLSDEVDGTSTPLSYTDEDGNTYSDESVNESLKARRLFAAKGINTPYGTQQWSGPVTLTSAVGESFDTFTADVAGGKLSVAGIRHTETLDSQELLSVGDGSEDRKIARQLVTMSVDRPAHLASAAIGIAPEDTAVAGEGVELAITLENDGLEPLADVQYRYALMQNGKELYAGEWATTTVNGGTANVMNANLALPEDLAGCSLVLQVRDAAGKALANAETKLDAVAQPVFSGEYAYINSDGNIVVSARLANTGTTAFNGNVSLTDVTADGSAPQLEQSMIELAANEATDVEFIVPMDNVTFKPLSQTNDDAVSLSDEVSFALACGEAGCVVDLRREIDAQSAAAFNALQSFSTAAGDAAINDGDTVTLLLSSPDYTLLTSDLVCGEGANAGALTTEYTIISGDDVVAVFEPTGQLTPLQVGRAQVKLDIHPAAVMQDSYGTKEIEGSRINVLDDCFYFPDKTITRTVNIVVKENATDPTPAPTPVPVPDPEKKQGDDVPASSTSAALPTIPKTGDNSPLTLIVLLMLGSALGLGLVLNKKRTGK